jgi:uncharacterized damage-inducible protein DinB
VSRPAPWFERRFEFSFPVELYPNLRVRLGGTPARIEELLRDLPRETLVRHRPGEWSIQEHAGHLLDLESLWEARVGDFLAGSAELTAADLTNRKTREAGHNDHPVREILGELRAARSRLLDRLREADRDTLSRSLLHPRLRQPMRLVDHLYFVAEHDDHHLAYMVSLMS